MVKDDAEVAALRTACAVADAALAELIADGGLAPGRTEREVALDLEYRMRGARRGGPVVRDDRRGGPALGRPAPQPDRRPAARAATS